MQNLMIIGGEKGKTREHGLRVIRAWMVYASDCVIIYERKFNAELMRLKESAEKQKKTIIEI